MKRTYKRTEINVLLHPLKFGISFAHRVEIEPGIIVLDWSEVHLEGLLDAVIFGQPCGPHDLRVSETYHRGPTLTGFGLLSLLIVVP